MHRNIVHHRVNPPVQRPPSRNALLRRSPAADSSPTEASSQASLFYLVSPGTSIKEVRTESTLISGYLGYGSLTTRGQRSSGGGPG